MPLRLWGVGVLEPWLLRRPLCGAREVDLEHQAVLIAPPIDRRKERFRSHTADIIQGGEAIDLDVLTDFLSRVKT